MTAHVKVQHFEYADSTITLALFVKVAGCTELKTLIVNRSIQAALLKSSLIVDPFQVLVAANKAVHLYRTNAMTTRNVHSEILFCLSPSKNISESFKLFGVSDDDASVLVALVDDHDDASLDAISKVLGTTPSPLDMLSKLTDTVGVTKIYKLTPEELSTYSVLDAVVSRIAVKEVISAGKGKS